MGFNLHEFVPKSVICFKEGYSKDYFLSDLFAGLSVGIIALPLALAFAIASGVTPEKGLYTAIIAGFLISLLGGSRVQIGGPTGAFVVIVYGVVQKYGYEGLALATLMAGLIMILMGFARLGVLLKFIPFPVTTGFTTGIAVIIFSSQIKDFFGLKAEALPPEFLEKCHLFCQIAHTWDPASVMISAGTLALIFILKHFFPKWPFAVIAITITSALAFFFQLPLETIESKFGGIPQGLPTPALPVFSYDLMKKVFPDAVTIALLGAIESLLSAVVADGMIGTRHRSNMELVAQGIANIGSILFGGIPATGAIARTTANIKIGAKTPVAGMLHCVTLAMLMIFLAPLASKIPLAALAGVLVFVAWNMSELPHFIEILKGDKSEAAILLITFFLTVLIDLTVAVQVGVILAAMVFLKKMTDQTSVKICQTLVRENEENWAESKDQDDLLDIQDAVPDDVLVFEIVGPFFYSVSDLLDEALLKLPQKPKFFILRLHKMPLIDSTGINALKRFSEKCRKKDIKFLITDFNEQQEKLFEQASLVKTLGKESFYKKFSEVLDLT